MPGFFVRHDNAAASARIYDWECNYYNNGRGNPMGPAQNPALWSGPFETIKEAEQIMNDFAACRPGANVDYCPHCIG